MTDSSKITWLIESNPKQAGTKAHTRFEQYFGARTLDDYLSRGGTMADLKWDLEHGFLEVAGELPIRRQSVSRKSRRTHEPHRDREVRIESATKALRAILELDILPAHKAELIGVCIWKITEADGKWNTRFRSKAAMGLPPGQCAHEHVHEIKKLRNRLMNGEDVDSVLSDVTACVVTRAEHSQLTAYSYAHPDVDGWDRYKGVGIEVIDLYSKK